jgi:hypothetical protein
MKALGHEMSHEQADSRENDGAFPEASTNIKCKKNQMNEGSTPAVIQPIAG